MSPIEKFIFQTPKPASYNTSHVGLRWAQFRRGNQYDILPYLWISEQEENSNQRVILYCHGNASDAGLEWDKLKQWCKILQSNCAIVEYPGYGILQEQQYNINHTNAKENTINDTVFSIWIWLVCAKNINPQNIILMGHSLGTGPCIWLANFLMVYHKFLVQYYKLQPIGETLCGGIVLISPYTNLRQVIVDHVGKFLANILVICHRWRSDQLIHKLTCPILFIHGKQDSVIPYHHSEILKQNSLNGTLILLPHQGHSCFNKNEICKHILKWLQIK